MRTAAEARKREHRTPRGSTSSSLTVVILPVLVVLVHPRSRPRASSRSLAPPSVSRSLSPVRRTWTTRNVRWMTSDFRPFLSRIATFFLFFFSSFLDRFVPSNRTGEKKRIVPFSIFFRNQYYRYIYSYDFSGIFFFLIFTKDPEKPRLIFEKEEFDRNVFQEEWKNVHVTHEFVLFRTHVLRPRLERLTGSFGNDLEQRLLAFARLSPSTASTNPILHSLSMGSRAIISFPCSRWKRERVANYEQFILRLNGFFRIFERTKLMISVYLPSFHFRSE